MFWKKLQLLVSTIDFRYITDVITPEEAVEMLKQGQNGKQERIGELLKEGYPCYTTQVGEFFHRILYAKKRFFLFITYGKISNFFSTGWLGYTDEYRRKLCKEYLAQGFNAFKLKVGQNLDDDRHRCRLVREEIGWENKLVCLIAYW